MNVPAVSRFVTQREFVDTNRITHMTDAFTREMRPKVEENVPEAVLIGYESLRGLKDMNTVEAVPGTIYLAHFMHLLSLPLKDAILLSKDGLNVAYVLGVHGARCAVSARWVVVSGSWLHTGWHVHAVDHYARVCGQQTDDPWSGPHEWPAGTRFIMS
jgi:hypothetical protein